MIVPRVGGFLVDMDDFVCELLGKPWVLGEVFPSTEDVIVLPIDECRHWQKCFCLNSQ